LETTKLVMKIYANGITACETISQPPNYSVALTLFEHRDYSYDNI